MEKMKVYGYRWVVLFVFALINAIVQVHWVNFASITGEAAAFYGVTPMQIGLLSMSFMVMYIFLCIPASYMIDTYGLRIGVGIGAALTGIFGLLKGIYATNYTIIFISQLGLAVAQPFVMNAMTKVSAKWFPMDERATATGLAALSQYVGIIIALAVTPFIFKAYAMKGMLMIYGISSVVAAIAFLVFIKDSPPTPSSEYHDEDTVTVFAGINRMFKHRDMILLLILFFFGLGMFNAVTTWIEQILSPRGFNSEQAGLIGGVMMIGGIIGAVILPLLSDKLRKRKPLLILTMIGIAPGLIGLTFATGFPMLLVSGFILGFFIMSAGPIGFQYGAEISYPTPESSSQGMLLLAGQISGIIFIYAMDKLRITATGSMTPFMIVFVVMALVNILLAFLMKESLLIRTQQDK
jgi:sugar phosphate permease